MKFYERSIIFLPILIGSCWAALPVNQSVVLFQTICLFFRLVLILVVQLEVSGVNGQLQIAAQLLADLVQRCFKLDDV